MKHCKHQSAVVHGQLEGAVHGQSRQRINHAEHVTGKPLTEKSHGQSNDRQQPKSRQDLFEQTDRDSSISQGFIVVGLSSGTQSMRIPYLKFAVIIVFAVFGTQWVSLHHDVPGLGSQTITTIASLLSTTKDLDQPDWESENELSIPLERKVGVWVVSVLVNDLYEAELIVDSGAATTTLSEDFAFDLGLYREPSTPTFPIETANGTVQGWSATVRSLDLGDIHLVDIPVVIVDLSNLADHQIDGLLGGNILNAYTWHLDHQRHRLTLSSL